MSISATKIQIIRLLDFNRTRFAPSIARLQVLLKDPTYLERRLRVVPLCSVLEAIAWLDIGAGCDYFPWSESQKLLAKDLHTIRTCLEVYRDLDASAFTPALEPEISYIIDHGAIRPSGHSSTDNLSRSFGTALMLSRSLALQPLADLTASALTFWDEDTWGDIERGSCRPEDVYGAFVRDASNNLGDLSLAVIGAGFLHVCEHMLSSEAFFQTHDIPSQFARKLGMLEAWRLRIHEPQVSSRFSSVARVVARAVGLSASDVLSNAPLYWIRGVAWNGTTVRDDFLQLADRLRESWIGDHSLWKEAAA